MNDKLAHILQSGITMQLATCVGSQPWVSTLFYAADGRYIYWVSSTKRRHSNEIDQNSKVSATIVIESDPDGRRLGVQLSGSAERIVDTIKFESAARLYVDKYNSGEEYLATISVMNEDHALYEMTIDSVALFDSENTPTIERFIFGQ